MPTNHNRSGSGNRSNRSPQRRSTSNRSSTSRGRSASRSGTAYRRKGQDKVSPYLCFSVMLCLVAVVLLVAILVIAFSEEPTQPAESSVPTSASSTPVFHTSSDGTSGGTSDNAGDESEPGDPSQGGTESRPTDIPITGPESSGPEESGPVETSQPEIPTVGNPGNPGAASQPAATQAYEKKVGKTYAIDMNPFEQYVCPSDPMEYVFLVDATHTLSANYVPPDLVRIKDMRAGRPDYYSNLRSCAEKALEAMLEEGRQYGITDAEVSNGYRSYNNQDYLFNLYCEQESAAHPDYTREQVEALVLTYSLRPGTSEHQSGLCLDFFPAEMSFTQKKAAKWLAENSYRFGFVLRYPQNKQSITTVMYEPWHFRFVGRVAATEMYELGMCLEEYCAYKGIS